MASELYTKDPRTGCWTPSEGVTAEDVYERFRGDLPYGSKLVEVCRTAGCANPEHLRPTFHISVEDLAEAFEVPVKVIQANPSLGHPVSSETIAAAPEPETPESAPLPTPPVKRGPGRPRKNPR